MKVSNSDRPDSIFPKTGLEAARMTLWASKCWPSSHARVTSVKSLSFRNLLKAELTFSLKSFHWRQSFSDIAVTYTQLPFDFMWVPQKDFSTFFRIFKFPCKWILFGQFSFYTYWLNCSFRVKFKEVHSWIFRLNRKMVGYQSKCTYSADFPIMQREKRLDLFYNIL